MQEKEKINHYLLSRHGLKNCEISYKCIYSDDREVYRIVVGGDKYIYKTRGSSSKSSDEFELEFNIMKKLYSKSACLINMPEPLLLIDSIGFLMTECDGEVLKDIYYKSILSSHAYKVLFKSIPMVAEWLSCFHMQNVRNHDYAEYYLNRLSHLKRMIDSIKELENKSLVLSNLNESLEYFYKTEYLDNAHISQLHGNFAMRNILVSPAVVSLIDFEDSKVDVIYYDMGMFVSEILNKSMYLINAKKNDLLIQTFVDVYSKKNKVNMLLLKAYVLYHLVWSYYEVTSRSNPDSYLKLLLIKYKKFHINRMLTKVIKGRSF